MPLKDLRHVPPDWKSDTEQRTVLKPADAGDISTHQLAQITTNLDQFPPSQPALLDSFVEGWLDAPSDSNLQSHIGAQLTYAYGCVARVQDPAFANHSRIEYRQLHRDCMDGH